MDTKRDLDAALAALVGLPLVRWNRVADMAAIGFGRFVAAERRGRKVRVAELALHIQETWRVADGAGTVLFGYGDWHYPPRGSTIPYDEFDEGAAPRNHQDDLRDEWLSHGHESHNVTSAGRTAAGDLAIRFADGCTLETFVNQSSVGDKDTLDDEFWRLIQQLPSARAGDVHFVVTARGVLPDGPST